MLLLIITVAGMLCGAIVDGDGWSPVQGANYVPSYSKHDVFDIFPTTHWNATTVDRELGYAKRLSVTSLRVFMFQGAYVKDVDRAGFIANYNTFQNLMAEHGLTLLTTFYGLSTTSCSNATDFINLIVAAEKKGVVIAYEADNEPAPYAMGYVQNCTLPALLKATAAHSGPGVKVGVGFAHFKEVVAMANLTTSLNWHSYNGIGNGAGLQSEIDTITKIANSFTPPKPLILTEWLARPAQPLLGAYPVIRDSNVAAYNWALVFDDCTTGWQKPAGPGDPPFQGMIWQNGTVFDDLEEGECMRTQCRTLEYVHHCCNMRPAQNSMFAFSGNTSAVAATNTAGHVVDDADDSSATWTIVSFGTPMFKRPGPRESSVRQTYSAGATVTVGPLPANTHQIALYLPTSSKGASFTIAIDGKDVYVGTTLGALDWVARLVLPVPLGSKEAVLTVGKDAAAGTTKFNVSGVTFFYANSTTKPPIA